MKKTKSVKKKIIKYVIISFILTLFFTMLTTNYSLASFKGFSTSGSVSDSGKLNSIVSQILGIIQFFGLSIAVIMIISVGISYFTKSHNPSEKAEVHKRLQTVLLGAVFVIGATGIVKLIQNLVLSNIIN